VGGGPSGGRGGPRALFCVCESPLAIDTHLRALGLGSRRKTPTNGVAWGWHGVGMGLAWGWHGVGMGLAWSWHGVSIGLAWGWHGVGMGLAWGRMGLAWGWHGVGMGVAWGLLIDCLLQSIDLAYWQSIDQSIRPTLAVSLYILYQCFAQLLDLDLDQLRRRAGKKRRGHDERNLAHQGSLKPLCFPGRIYTTRDFNGSVELNTQLYPQLYYFFRPDLKSR
jgi:hypothetical protein